MPLVRGQIRQISPEVWRISNANAFLNGPIMVEGIHLAKLMING